MLTRQGECTGETGRYTGPMKILHLDDHELFTEGLRAVLERSWEGCRVHCATEVGTALAILERDAEWDLLLADMNMPGMDGRAFLRSLAERQSLVPVVMMSAEEDPFLIRDAMQLGALGFVPKQFSTDAIVDALNEFLEQGMYLPQDLAQQLQALPASRPATDRDSLLARFKITERQLQVLELMQEGYANREIAQVLHVSENTVKTHVKVLFQAIGVGSRLECVREAQRVGLLASGIH